MSPHPEDDSGTMTQADDALMAGLLRPLDSQPGPARFLTPARGAALARSVVQAALAAANAPAASAGLIAPSVSFPSAPLRVSELCARAPVLARRRRTHRTYLLAATLAVFFSVGAAATSLVAQTLKADSPPEPAQIPRSPRKPAVRAPPSETRWAAPEAVASSPAEVPSAGRALRPKPSVAAAIPEAKLDEAPPEDLLALANQKRREKDWSAADGLYQSVSRRFPRSGAAVVAEIASATLHLEHLGDPAGALRDYRHALALQPAGALAEEARWGVAEALRALGDAKGEGAALQEFLDQHPSSMLAPAARRRQAEVAQ